MNFAHGRFLARAQPAVLRDGEARIKFEPIGIGRPLIVEVRRVYTGSHPAPGWFSESKDMLVTSAMKSIATFNAAPRAVNFLKKGVERKTTLTQVAATSDGTPLVYYSPALTEYNSVLTIEFGFDEFDDTISRMIGQAFTQAAGIPVFASASVYLLAAGAVTKLATNVATRLLDKKPIFEATEPIQFLRAGTTAAKSGFALITQDDLESRTLDESHVNDAGELVNDAGEQYRGPIPFVAVSYDGREVDGYENFTPTAAAATTLDRFYSIRDNEERELSLLMDSLKLYNDLKFRRRADELLAEMGELEDGSEKYNRKKVEYDAAIANIMEDLLKPKDLWYNPLPRATSHGGFGWGGSQIVRLSMVGPAS
jgi:hypothetical protein